MNPETISSIQRAGQAVQDAHDALANEASEYSSLVMQSMTGDAFNVENDARFEQWKTVARIAQTLQGINDQLKQAYFAAGQIAMGGGPSKTSSARRLALTAPLRSAATDVVAKPAKKARLKKASRKQSDRTTDSAPKQPSARSAVSASGLKGNAGRALDFLMTKLNKDGFSRVTHAEIAEGAPIPTGSVGAAVSALAKLQKIEEGERGSYKLL